MSHRKIKAQLQTKKIRTKRKFYVLILISIFISVIYDSFHYNIPFYYILYFFVGIGLGAIERSMTSNIFWDKNQNQLVETQDYVQIAIFGILLLFRIFVLPYILDENTHPIHIYDATALITFGVFYHKIKTYQKAFNSALLDSAIENHGSDKRDSLT